MSDVDFGAKAFALIVGISTFEDAAYANKPIPQAVHDAEDLASLLPRRLGWKNENIQVHAGTVRKNDLQTAFRNLAAMIGSLGTADLFLFYLSTHGHPYKTQSSGAETILLATDTLLTDQISLVETGINRHILGYYIDAVPARQKVVISDACFAASAMSTAGLVPPQPYAGIDAAVLSSSAGRSWVLPDQRNSGFTNCLLTVLSNSEGEIGVGGLADEISRTLPEGWPPPFLDTRGRYIMIGVVGRVTEAPQPLTFEQLLMFSQSQLQLVLTRYRNEVTSAGYVPRKTVQRRFEVYLGTPGSEPFSIIGAAGVGKSTLLMHLAEEANNQGFAVLWFSGAYLSGSISIESLIATAISGLSKTVTMTELGRVLETNRPLLLFIDAINEWSSEVVALESLIGSLQALEASGRFRAIFTCREEIWLRLNQKRREAEVPEFNTSAQLDIFDEEEFAEAQQIYGIHEIGFDKLSRQPLFLRMASAVLAARTDSDVGTFMDLFAKYVEAKTRQAGMRLGLDAGQTLSRVERVAVVLSQNNAESMPVDQFLEIVSEPLAVALFDEGLFRRVGESVSFETELLYEYVLSRTLPPDPFAEIKDLSSIVDQTYDSAWWRAAAFRLWAMTDVERVRQILKLLTSDENAYAWRVAYVMQLGLHWKDIMLFKEQYLKAFELVYEYPPDETFILLRQILQKPTRERVQFVMDAIRILFRDDYHYDWRPKKWDSLDLNGLRQPFTSRDDRPDCSAYLLHECFVVLPYETLYILVSQWLSDSSKLTDNETEISNIAAMFLSAYAPEKTTEFQQAVTDALRNENVVFSVDGGLWLHQVLAWVVKHRPSAFIDIASVWTADPSPNFQFLGLEIVRNLPADLGATAVGIVTRYLMRPDIPLQMANQAITWIGSIPSRKVLEFLIEQGKLAEHQAAVADACRFLFPVFPDEVLKLIGQLAAQPVIRTDVREAIVNFYRSQLAVTGKYATQFFRSAIEAEPGKYQRDISRSVGRLRRGDPYVTEFVEEQLKVETDGETFEHYGYYLKQVRLLAIEDVPWLQRWIDSGTPTYGLLGYAAMSPLPTATKLELVAALDQRNPSFIRYCINSIRRNEDEALRKLAVEALNWPAYASLSARAQKWFALMAAGKSPYDAYDAVRRDR